MAFLPERSSLVKNPRNPVVGNWGYRRRAFNLHELGTEHANPLPSRTGFVTWCPPVNVANYHRTKPVAGIMVQPQKDLPASSHPEVLMNSTA
jgi:hypothetical protein